MNYKLSLDVDMYKCYDLPNLKRSMKIFAYIKQPTHPFYSNFLANNMLRLL